ncbi:MAG TPA: hypothetical protein VI548_09750 [Chitinophagaceae bacterium]|nr:hypothetical protein [Chitinophagaceae bacterium]
MSINLLETVQTQLRYPALRKIDPNTQVESTDNIMPDEHQFGQAAIPGILTALYKFSRTDDGADNILQGSVTSNWTALIFGDQKESIIQKIAGFSNLSLENAEAKMNTIAVTAITTIKENLPAKATIHDVKVFLAGQRNDILLYLPAVLQLGEILNDNTLDDRTNKMEGPLSSLMHKIGDKFSEGEAKKNDTVFS